MGKIISVANQKGGVGKTTTSVNLAACIADDDCKTLLVDMDPQGNATSGLGVDREDVEYSTYHQIVGEASPRDVILDLDHENLFLAPSGSDLAGAEVELANLEKREYQLAHVMHEIRDEFDFIVIDCPPSLGLLTVNALTASDSVLVPIQAEYYALEGVSLLHQTIQLVQNYLNPDLSVEGVLLTMYDARTNLSEQVADEVNEHFGGLVFETMIPRNVRLSEAPSYGEPITEYASSSRGAKSYRKFADEFLERNAPASAE